MLVQLGLAGGGRRASLEVDEDDPQPETAAAAARAVRTRLPARRSCFDIER